MGFSGMARKISDVEWLKYLKILRPTRTKTIKFNPQREGVLKNMSYTVKWAAFSSRFL